MSCKTLLLSILLVMLLPNDKMPLFTDGKEYTWDIRYVKTCISDMEALDLVKEQYAANFEKEYVEGSKDSYFYKLRSAEYYLEYEGYSEKNLYYLIHLYEFVIDEPELGIGHTVTYGWYSVNRFTGKIIDQTK